jgi:peptidoglycan/LPS O-acetylase OafA/YrhL
MDKLELREWSSTGTISLREFYRRRALRVLPAYAGFVLAVLVLTDIGVTVLNRSEWRGLLTYSMNFVDQPRWEVTHLWSLSTEEQFYFVWPPLLLLLGPKRARRLVLGIFVGLPLLRAGIWEYNLSLLQMQPDRFLLKRADCINAGCLLALLAADPHFRDRVRLSPRAALGLCALCIAVLASSQQVANNSLYQLGIGHPLNAAAICGLIWFCTCHPQTVVGRLLCSRPMVALGTLSYSLYLWQQPLLANRDGWMCAWPINLVLAVGAAVLSNLFLERPFLRLKEARGREALVRPTATGQGSADLQPHWS